MAVITPASIVSEIRGSVGDVTYSRNRYGPYVKAKLVQPASATALQIAIRAALTAGNVAWHLTTGNTRKSWATYVRSYKRQKNISRKITLSAYNEFVGRYINKAIIDGSNSGFLAYPTNKFYPYLTSVTQSSASIILNWKTGETTSDVTFVVYATASLPSTINQINKSDYKVVGYFTPSGSSGAEDVYTMINTYYTLTSADAGKRIGIAIKSVNDENYAANPIYYSNILLDSSVVSAPPSIVQSVVKNTAGAGTTKTVTFGSAPAENNLILLFIETATQPTITDPTGFTTLFTVDQGGGRFRACYKIAGASEPTTYTFTLSVGVGAFHGGCDITGVDTTTPINDHKTNQGSASIANPVGATDASALDNSLALAVIMSSNGGMAFVSITNSFVQVDASNNGNMQFAEVIIPTASSTVNTVWDWNAGRNFCSAVICISPP